MSEKSLFDTPKKSSDKGLFDKPSSAKDTSEKGLFDKADSTAKSSTAKATPKKTSTKSDSDDINFTKNSQSKSQKGRTKNTKKFRKIFLISLAAVVLIGGGVVGALFFFWYNSDEGIFASAVQNFMTGNRVDILMDGELTIGDDASMEFEIGMLSEGTDGQLDLSAKGSFPERRWVTGKTTYKCGSEEFETFSKAYEKCGRDYEYDYVAGHYEDNGNEFDLSGSAIFLPEGYYVKTDIDKLADLISESLSGLEEYSNKWMFIDTERINELIDDEDASELQTCLEDVTDNNAKIRKRVYELLFTGDLITAKAEKPEKRKNDRTRYALAFSQDVDDYAKFIRDFYEMDIIDNMLDCYSDNIDDFSREEIDDVIEEMLDSLDDLSDADRKSFASTIKEYAPKITITVDTSTRQISKIEIKGDFDGTTFSLVMDVKAHTRKDEKIEAPSKFTDIDDIVDSLEDLF